MFSAECNYEIYDKELLIIIWAFKHWRLELKLTDISIKMFIDHQALISLMKDKELSRRQMRWVQKFADFNFRIMYQSDKQNIKIDALTHRADVVLRDSEDERVHYQCRLIVELSFKLTFWIRLDSKSSCSHFQLDLSRIAHIFNSTRLDSTENWVNSTRLVKNLSLTSRELNIEIFPIFCFCIIFLHYLFDRSHDEKHEDYMIESHEEKSW